MNSFAHKLIWFGTLGAFAGIVLIGSQNPFAPSFLWRGLVLLIFGCTVIAIGGWQLYKKAHEARPIRKRVSNDNVWAAATETTAVVRTLALVALFAIVLAAGMWASMREKERIRNRDRELRFAAPAASRIGPFPDPGAEMLMMDMIGVDPEEQLRIRNGRRLIEDEEYAAAIEELNTPLGQPVGTASLLFYRGRAKQATGQCQAAVDDLSAFLAFQQKTNAYDIYGGWGWYYRSLACAELGDLEHAVADLSRAIDHNDGVPDYFKARATAYDQLGLEDPAAADRRRVGELQCK